MKETKKQRDVVNKFLLQKYKAEILGDLYSRVKEDYDRLFTSYEKVGVSTEQAKHWKTGELLWDDEAQTIPHYDAIYDYVPVDEDTWDEATRCKATAMEEIIEGLEGLLG